METITFTLGGHKKMVYESTLTEGQILCHYLAVVKEDKLPNLLDPANHKSVEVPSFLIGAYRAKGYEVDQFNKGCGTYKPEVVPELVFQVVRKREYLSWERVD